MKKVFLFVFLVFFSALYIFAVDIQGNNDSHPFRYSSIDQTTWTLRFYVDEFGDDTEVSFLTSPKLKGKNYSNQDVLWYFIVDSRGVAVKLYSNSWENPLKGNGSYKDRYVLEVKDSNNEVYSFLGSNYSDKIWFTQDADKLKSLLNSGEVKVNIKNTMDSSKIFKLGSFNGQGLNSFNSNINYYS